MNKYEKIFTKIRRKYMEKITVITESTVAGPTPRGVICGVGCASGFFCF